MFTYGFKSAEKKLNFAKAQKKINVCLGELNCIHKKL